MSRMPRMIWCLPGTVSHFVSQSANVIENDHVLHVRHRRGVAFISRTTWWLALKDHERRRRRRRRRRRNMFLPHLLVAVLRGGNG